MKTTCCRICGHGDRLPILDLGDMPLANRFIRPEQHHEPEPRFPLRLVLCAACGAVQLDEVVPRDVLFRDYIYVSGTSDLVHRHAAWLAKYAVDRYGLTTGDLVVEAASNDGSILKAFRWLGLRTLGIEPSSNIADVAREQGIDTVVDYFDERLGRELRSQVGPVKLLLARHVLAHVEDLQGFVAGIEALLAPEGVALIECPHLVPFYEGVEFDTIYHEHLCYFSLAVLQTLFGRHGLVIHDAQPVAIHGGSLVVHVSRPEAGYPISPRLQGILQREENLHLRKMPAWRLFADKVARVRRELPAFLDRLRLEGRTIAGYGAPAKGNTLLCACGIGPDRLAFTVDRSPAKQGLLTPGMHIPVRPPEALLAARPDVCLILAWNFADEIIVQQAAYREAGGTFALPLPIPALLTEEARVWARSA
jgi:novobiocin biosynthesis protein NovU/D-mycarose 3-C-methyltransferase